MSATVDSSVVVDRVGASLFAWALEAVEEHCARTGGVEVDRVGLEAGVLRKAIEDKMKEE